MEKLAKFNGKWKLNPEKNKNFDEFHAKSGHPAAVAEKFRKAAITTEFKINGDQIHVSISTPGMSKSLTEDVTLGKEKTGNDAAGKIYKLTFSMEPDGTLTEVKISELTGGKALKIKRRVEGNKMFVTREIEGVQMEQEWDKIA